MSTLKELSELTGYSSATISRILSGDPSLSVTPEARRRVLEAAGRLNYQATRSRRGRTPKALLRIGLAEMLTPDQQLEDPYYLYLSGFVRRLCREKKYACQPLERRDGGFFPQEEGVLDGIVAVGIFTAEQREGLAALSPNVVFLDSCPEPERFDSVVLDYALGITLALEHLTSLGHLRIGFVGPTYKLDDQGRRAPEIRRHLFLQLAEERGMKEGAVLLDCPMETGAAAQAVRGLIRSGAPLPTALLCANEEGAVGALRALEEAGISVPGGISLLSFNDTPRSALLDPPLTSVAAHEEEMAAAALRLLSERACPADTAPIRTLPLKLVVPPTLTLRASTGPAEHK